MAGAVVGSVALAEAAAPAAAPAAPVSTPVPAPVAGTVGTMSFVDGPAANDRAAEVLDEVLGGEAPAETPPADPDKTPVEVPKPAETPAETAPEAPPTNDVEAARLRKGFAKLAAEQQKVLELQNAARAEKSAAQQYATKAQKYDELTKALETDPAAFIQAHGGEALVQKALQGFIDMEKSPAEREVAKLRQEREQEKRETAQREQELKVVAWRNDVISKVKADERFDLVNSLGLQTKVIDVIAGYYEKNSQRNDKGEVIVPAILPWDQAAQAVEDAHATALEGSKRYGKRAPAPPPATAETKPTPPAKPAAAPAKKAPTSLSSVPVADSPHTEADYSADPDERQAQILAEMGL